MDLIQNFGPPMLGGMDTRAEVDLRTPPRPNAVDEASVQMMVSLGADPIRAREALGLHGDVELAMAIALRSPRSRSPRPVGRHVPTCVPRLSLAFGNPGSAEGFSVGSASGSASASDFCQPAGMICNLRPWFDRGPPGQSHSQTNSWFLVPLFLGASGLLSQNAQAE